MVCKYCTIIINKTKYSIMDKVVEDSVLKNLRWYRNKVISYSWILCPKWVLYLTYRASAKFGEKGWLHRAIERAEGIFDFIEAQEQIKKMYMSS